GFVAVHAAGDEGHRQRGVPAAAAQGAEREAPVGAVVEFAVLHDIEAVAEGGDGGHHLLVAPPLALARAPGGLFGGTPGHARGADGGEVGLVHAPILVRRRGASSGPYGAHSRAPRRTCPPWCSSRDTTRPPA